MGHEDRIICQHCKEKVKKTGESKNGRIVYFACKCGKTTYHRSAGL